ncbi:MAG TPA: cytochrome c3 family protein [Anaerolineales bacterium]|nr:cytochrome c3 family protein [Anaerolineales bacterium]
MRNNRLGCLSGTGILAALITALVIAGYAYARGGLMYNPGPLNSQSGEGLGGVTSHAATGGECKVCHVAPWESATMADRCAACHTDIAEQMRAVATLHGSLMHNNSNLGCRDCHPEHRGPDAQLTVMEDVSSFPHEAVGFSLKGHQQSPGREPFTCADCHHGDITTFALDTCDACHRQMDAAFMTAHTLSFGPACLDCHDGVDRLGKNFDHNVFSFKLAGKHVALACVQCHVNARGFGDFAVALQDCDSCHQKDEPHEGRFGFNCADCHTETGWSPAKFDHNLAAFKLEGEHAEVACESCHVNKQFKGTPTDCYSCHQKDDEHHGEYGTDCALCHNPSSWDDADFDHNRTKFPLVGGHAGVSCQSCHSSGQFAGLSRVCNDCHSDPAFHAGMFGLNCVGCHTVNNWSAKYTGPHPGIADEGGSGVHHGGASCRDCHTQTLYTATCTKCHNGNPEGDGGGGGGHDD